MRLHVFCLPLQIRSPPFPTLPVLYKLTSGGYVNGLPSILAFSCRLCAIGARRDLGGKESKAQILSLRAPPCGISGSGLLAGSPLPRAVFLGFQQPLFLHPFGPRGVNVTLPPAPEHCALLPLPPPRPSVNGPFIKHSSNHPV